MGLTFKIGRQIKNGSGPFGDEFSRLLFVFFRFFGMFVEVHDSFADP